MKNVLPTDVLVTVKPRSTVVTGVFWLGVKDKL